MRPVARHQAACAFLLLCAAASAGGSSNPPVKGSRVLCYGDSLTAGFWAGGRRFHPYAIQLARRLGGCTVDWIGLSGYTSAQMAATLGRNATAEGDVDTTQRRWRSLDEALERAQPPYTHVVILAGTNDLSQLSRHAGGARTAGDVVSDIVALHQRALAAGARTLALTVPQPAFESLRPQLALGRGEINDGLRAFAGASSTLLVELETALPHLNASAELRASLWDDGLHLTPAGYDALGDVVGAALTDNGATHCDGTAAAGVALELHR